MKHVENRRIEEGAPVVYLSDSARPMVIELSVVTGWRLGRVQTSIGQSIMLLDGPTISHRVEGPMVAHGQGAMHVWPDGTWCPEAATLFVSHLCESGLCDHVAACELLTRHSLWWSPFAEVDWRDEFGRAIGGLRVLLCGAGRAPICEVLLRDGMVASPLEAFVHAGRMAG